MPSTPVAHRRNHEYPPELREMIVKLHTNDNGYGTLARLFDMPRSSVRTIVLKFKKSGLVINKPRSGRKRITTQREDRLITGIVKQNCVSSVVY